MPGESAWGQDQQELQVVAEARQEWCDGVKGSQADRGRPWPRTTSHQYVTSNERHREVQRAQDDPDAHRFGVARSGHEWRRDQTRESLARCHRTDRLERCIGAPTTLAKMSREEQTHPEAGDDWPASDDRVERCAWTAELERGRGTAPFAKQCESRRGDDEVDEIRRDDGRDEANDSAPTAGAQGDGDADRDADEADRAIAKFRETAPIVRIEDKQGEAHQCGDGRHNERHRSETGEHGPADTRPRHRWSRQTTLMTRRPVEGSRELAPQPRAEHVPIVDR